MTSEREERESWRPSARVATNHKEEGEREREKGEEEDTLGRERHGEILLCF